MFCPWAQHFETLLLGAPLQNVDVDIAHAPAFHLRLGRLVKIDRAGADQRRSISSIINSSFVSTIRNRVPRGKRDQSEAALMT